jgi:hypothetical protein
MNLVIARSEATQQSSDLAFALTLESRGAGLLRCARNDESRIYDIDVWKAKLAPLLFG